jgi:hypothetical protein
MNVRQTAKRLTPRRLKLLVRADVVRPGRFVVLVDYQNEAGRASWQFHA